MAFHPVPGSTATTGWRHLRQGHDERADDLWVQAVPPGAAGRGNPGLCAHPANLSDLAAGHDLILDHTDLETLGDKASIGAAVAAALWEQR